MSRTYYGVAKAAVNMLTQQIAVQYGRQGIRCNAVLPGFTVSKATEKAMPKEFKEMAEAYTDQTAWHHRIRQVQSYFWHRMKHPGSPDI